MRKTTIGVIGNASRPGTTLPQELLEHARSVGGEIARAGCVLVTGGTGGVMEAASQGAKEAGGTTVGFLPQSDYDHANAYLDIAFPTGLGTLRNVLTARCSDAVIMIGGGVGTLNELTVAYDVGAPVTLLEGSGGWADRIRSVLIDGVWLDERRVVPLSFAADAVDAVSQSLTRATDPRAEGRLTAFIGSAGQ